MRFLFARKDYTLSPISMKYLNDLFVRITRNDHNGFGGFYFLGEKKKIKGMEAALLIIECHITEFIKDKITFLCFFFFLK